MEVFYHHETYISLVTLTTLLIVLDIDNVIFMSILTLSLPDSIQQKARRNGLFIGMIVRAIMLLSVGLIIQAEHKPLFTLFDRKFTLRHLIMIAGGLFLIYKCVIEIHQKIENKDEHVGPRQKTLARALIQLTIINIIFSIDSVITAVGMVKNIWIMLIAMTCSMILMYIFQFPISKFVTKHPTFKILALSFLLLIGVLLVGEGTHFEVPKGYIYFAMLFSFFVELLNLRMKKNIQQPETILKQDKIHSSETTD